MKPTNNSSPDKNAAELANRMTGLASDGLFDNLDNLKLKQDFCAAVGVKKVITTIRVDKPKKQDFVRVRPGADNRMQAAILEVDETRETFLVLPQIQEGLIGDIKPVCLVTAITRHGTLFVWPLRLPAPGRSSDSWAESAIEAAKIAEQQWTNVKSDQSAGMYIAGVATAEIPEPEWPELPFNKILEIAFRGRIIDSLEHDVVLRLRGAK